MAEVNLPEGFHFVPKDYQLINYLRRRKNNQPQPANPIMEVDLYHTAIHPKDLFRGKNQVVYVFTTLKKKKPEHRRVERNSGEGKWKIQKSDRVFDPDDGHEIGENATLRFETKKVQQGPKGEVRYIMHQYSLLESEKFLDVLCVISLKESKGSSASDEVSDYEDESPEQENIDVVASSVNQRHAAEIQERGSIILQQGNTQSLLASDFQTQALTANNNGSTVENGTKRRRDHEHRDEGAEQSKRMCLQCESGLAERAEFASDGNRHQQINDSSTQVVSSIENTSSGQDNYDDMIDFDDLFPEGFYDVPESELDGSTLVDAFSPQPVSTIKDTIDDDDDIFKGITDDDLFSVTTGLPDYKDEWQLQNDGVADLRWLEDHLMAPHDRQLWISKPHPPHHPAN